MTVPKIPGRLSNWLVILLFSAWLYGAVKASFLLSFDPWVGGDWLINYAGGFVRRGLLGSVYLHLSGLTGVSPVNYAVATKIVCCGAVTLFMFCLAWKGKIGLYEVVLCMAPWAFMFDLNAHAYGSGRKEILLIAFFCLFVYLCSYKKIGASTQAVVLAGVLPMIVLAHEGMFAFYPFFLLYYATGLGLDFKSLVARVSPALLLSILAVAASYYLKGGAYQADAICDSLVGAGLDRSNCNGAIRAINDFASPSSYAGYYQPYVTAGFLAFGPLIAYAKASQGAAFKKFFLWLLFCLAFTIPIYVVAIDWGRWLHVAALLTLIVLISSNHGRLAFKIGNKAMVLGLLAIFYVYIFDWVLPHCCVTDVYVKASNLGQWLNGF